jgi:hypothetical protein
MPIDAPVKARTGALKSAMKAGGPPSESVRNERPKASESVRTSDLFAGNEGLTSQRSANGTERNGTDAESSAAGLPGLALPFLTTEPSSESLLRSPLASPSSPTAPPSSSTRALEAGSVHSMKGNVSAKRPASELRYAPTKLGASDEAGSNPDTPTARSDGQSAEFEKGDEFARGRNGRSTDSRAFLGLVSPEKARSWADKRSPARGSDEEPGGGARWAVLSAGGPDERTLRSSLGEGGGDVGKASIQGKLSILKKKQGSRRAHSANAALQRIPNSYSEGDVSVAELQAAPFKFAPGTAAASTAYRDGEFGTGGFNRAAGRDRGSTAHLPERNTGLSDEEGDPFASSFKNGFGGQQGRNADPLGEEELPEKEGVAEGKKLVRRVSKATLQRRAMKEKEAAAAAELGLPADVSVGRFQSASPDEERGFRGAGGSRLAGGGLPGSQNGVGGGRSRSPPRQKGGGTVPGEGNGEQPVSPPRSSGKPGAAAGRDLQAAAAKPVDEIVTEDLQVRF